MKHNLEKRVAVFNLLNEGFNVKEVFLKTKVTEKTISKWVLEHKSIDDNKFETIKNLTTRLNKLSIDKDSKTSDIMYLTLCIKEIEDSVFINKKRSSQK